MAATACSAISDLVGADSVSAVPDVEGQWRGTFTTPDCVVSAAPLEGFCARVVQADPVPFALTLAQFDTEVVGSLQLAGVLVPLNGSIDDTGRILLAGSASAPVGSAGTVTVTIRDWNTVASNDDLTGGWSSEAIAETTGDTAQATHAIVAATKTS